MDADRQRDEHDRAGRGGPPRRGPVGRQRAPRSGVGPAPSWAGTPGPVPGASRAAADCGRGTPAAPGPARPAGPGFPAPSPSPGPHSQPCTRPPPATALPHARGGHRAPAAPGPSPPPSIAANPHPMPGPHPGRTAGDGPGAHPDPPGETPRPRARQASSRTWPSPPRRAAERGRAGRQAHLDKAPQPQAHPELEDLTGPGDPTGYAAAGPGRRSRLGPAVDLGGGDPRVQRPALPVPWAGRPGSRCPPWSAVGARGSARAGLGQCPGRRTRSAPRACCGELVPAAATPSSRSAWMQLLRGGRRPGNRIWPAGPGPVAGLG